MLLDISPEIEDSIIREIYIKEIADTFKISEQSLRGNIRTYNTQAPPVKEQRQTTYKYEEERKLLKFLLKNTSLIKRAAEALDPYYFMNDNLRKIYAFLIAQQDEEIIDNPALLIDRINQDDSIMIEEMSLLFFDEDFLDNIDDLIRQVKLRKLKQDLEELNKKYTSDTENSDYLEKKYFIKKEITKLSKNVVRKTIYL
jgi:replicative DNA helicase